MVTYVFSVSDCAGNSCCAQFKSELRISNKFPKCKRTAFTVWGTGAHKKKKACALSEGIPKMCTTVFILFVVNKHFYTDLVLIGAQMQCFLPFCLCRLNWVLKRWSSEKKKFRFPAWKVRAHLRVSWHEHSIDPKQYSLLQIGALL